MPLYRVTTKVVSPNAGGECLNVMHIRTSAPTLPGDSDLSEAMTAMRAMWGGIKNIYPNGAQIIVGDTIIGDPYGSPEYVPFTPTPFNGNDGGGVAPPHLAVVVGLRTTSATRSGRGRVFLGPLNSVCLQSTDGTVNTTELDLIRTSWATFVADSVTANGWALAVWSGVDNQARDVTSVAVRDSLAVMRSRRP